MKIVLNVEGGETRVKSIPVFSKVTQEIQAKHDSRKENEHGSTTTTRIPTAKPGDGN